MRRFLTHYAAFFRQPDVPRLLAIALVMRMPVGMMSLGMLMHLRELSGSFAFAGAMVGTYLVAMASTAPIQGRLIDRYGPRGVLIATGIVHPAALGLLLFAAPLHLPLTAIAPLAIVAGAFITPISVLTRTASGPTARGLATTPFFTRTVVAADVGKWAFTFTASAPAVPLFVSGK